MTDVPNSVKTYTEPQLFPSGGIALQVSALIDLEELTVVFVCEGRDVSAGKLLSLWSSSPVGIESYYDARERAISEFSEELRRFTGPFP